MYTEFMHRAVKKGFAPLVVLVVGLLAATIGGMVYLGRLKGGTRGSENVESLSPPSPGVTDLPDPTMTPRTTSKPLASPTITIPPLRTITVGGFTYEDRNDDGIFNSDDPKLPNMQIYVYDGYKPDTQISSIFSDASGGFSLSIQVRGSVILKPTTYNNFKARGGNITVTSNTNNLQIGFRSVSAPIPNLNVGIIEGDVYQDANKNLARDSGESGVYFYKLYLIDASGNYYNTVQNAQTTETSGHFKYTNLPIDRSYTIKLSNPTGEYDIEKADTNVTLSTSQTEATNIQIPVYKY